MAPGRARPRLPCTPLCLLAVLALVAGLAPLGASAPGAGPDLTVEPSQASYPAGQPVVLEVENNGTTPAEGTPTVHVHHCPLGADLCGAHHETVHTWEGDQQRLAPDEGFEVTWNRSTDEGGQASEGAYRAHLVWNGTGSTGDAEATSPAFQLSTDGTPAGPDAPRIHVASPGLEATLTDTRVRVDVTVRGTAPLDHVRVTVGETVIAEQHDLDTRVVNVTATVERAPGSHALEVTARDAEDRQNRTRVPFAVAPSTPLSAGGVAFSAAADGAVTDVRVHGEPLFAAIEAHGTTPQLAARGTGLGLAVRAPAGAAVEAPIDEGWRATEHPGGLALEHASGAGRVVLATTAGPAPSLDAATVTARLPAGAELVVRPVTDTPGDGALADAILDERLGAEVHLPAGSGDADVLAYGPMNATVAAREDRVAAILEAPGPAGQSVAVHLPAGAFPDAEAHLDGTRLSTGSLAEALSPGEAPTANVHAGEDATRVVVAVDGFSAREVVVQVPDALDAAPTLGALVLGGGLVAVAAWGMFRP